jgi:hypothetical protein
LNSSPENDGQAGLWLRLAAIVLVAATLGLPINDLFRFALLGIAIVVVFAGAISTRLEVWVAALAVVVVAVLGQALFPAPRIEEGHNVFIVDGGRSGALERGLPAGAFRLMAAEFDARYPREKRCDPNAFGCWRGQGFPERTFAFSADGIHDRPAYSRRAVDIDFSDPVWSRLGFINESQYNWFGTSDVQREKRERSLWMVLHPWRLSMPYFVMYRFPADFAGSWLCWQGEVLWEGDGERFTVWRHAQRSCRPIEPTDAGRRIFGVSIASPLAMSLEPTAAIQWRRLVEPGLALAAFAAVLMLLVRWRARQLTLPFTLIGLSLAVVLLNDASFIGGVRPFDGGDDGLFYEGAARRIVQHVLAGEYALALEGGEKVFFYGGPGLRYLRALEHFIFGDSFLGYLLLLLVMPFVVLAVFRRFFSVRVALGMTLVFVAIPIGALFGTSLFHYAKWAARGFADPAAAVAFLAGLIVLIGRTSRGPGMRFTPALGAGLLFALALWVRPNLAPGAAVLLGGTGLAALWHGEWRLLAGLCIGFLPVFGMALHNWHFGGVFVLFSANATVIEAFPMPPSAYVAAMGELLRLDLGGEHVRRWVLQWGRWLAGPSESLTMAPLHVAAIAVLVRVVLARTFDPWLRLVSGTALALHPVAWFYVYADRYHYLAWFLTLLVVAVWIRDEGADLARRLSPGASQWVARHPTTRWLSRVLDWWAGVTGVAPRVGKS